MLRRRPRQRQASMGYVLEKNSILLLTIFLSVYFLSKGHSLFCLFLFCIEMASATRLNFLELRNKDGEDIIYMNTYKRCQKCTEFMHMAAATAALDPVTRADIALRCVSICWRGLWVSSSNRNGETTFI